MKKAYKAEWKTAREMALTPHNLSSDALVATINDTEVFKWSKLCNVWAGPFERMPSHPKPPKR